MLKKYRVTWTESTVKRKVAIVETSGCEEAIDLVMGGDWNRCETISKKTENCDWDGNEY